MANLKCENCFVNEITKEQYLKIDIGKQALCTTCEKLTRAQRKKAKLAGFNQINNN